MPKELLAPAADILLEELKYLQADNYAYCESLELLLEVIDLTGSTIERIPNADLQLQLSDQFGRIFMDFDTKH